MKLISKFAATGAAAAVVAGGLVAATGTTATAATQAVTYNCDLSPVAALLPPGTDTTQPVTATYTIPALPATVPVGAALPALPLSATITVPPAVSGIVVVGFGGKISGSVVGNVAFGAQSVAATLNIPEQTITNAAESATVNAAGTLASFTPANLGANAVSLPGAVTANLGGQSFSCTSVAGSNLAVGSVNVVKPTLKATAKKVKAGHVAKIKVVTTPAQTGKAIAKVGKKKVAKATLKNGKATLKVKGLKKTTKVKVIVGKLTKTVKVKIKK